MTDLKTPTAPKTLNGFPVIGSAPSRLGYDALTVMVDRGETSSARYVVATWSEHCGDSWTWGGYCATFEQACAALVEKAYGCTIDAVA